MAIAEQTAPVVAPACDPAPAVVQEPVTGPVPALKKWDKVRYTSRAGRTDTYLVLWSGITRNGKERTRLVKGRGHRAFWVDTVKLTPVEG